MNSAKNWELFHSPFPFQAALALKTWLKWNKNQKYYSVKSKEDIYRDIVFWLNYDLYDVKYRLPS